MYILIYGFSFLLFLIIISGIFTVKQQSAVIIERFGKFHSIRHPGLNFKMSLYDFNIQSKELSTVRGFIEKIQQFL